MVGHQVRARNLRSQRRNTIFGPIRFLQSRSQADLCPLRPGGGTAAFMPAAALVGPESDLGTRVRDRIRSCRRARMVVAARRASILCGQGLAKTVVVYRRHRSRDCHRGECPRKQDQQQQFGGQAVHIFQGSKGGASLRLAIPHIQHSPPDEAASRRPSAASLSIGQFGPRHNPR